MTIGDNISRLIVQEAITKSIALKENPHQMYERIQAIPSVTPQRPKGKWLDKKTTIKGAHGLAYGRYGCSVCKRKFPAKSNFCPNCGAEMEGFRNEP